MHLRPQVIAARRSDEVLVVAERSTRLVRVEPRSGDTRWAARVEDPWGTLALGPDVCLYLSQRGVLRCLSLADGSLRWTVDVGVRRSNLAVVGDVVCLGGWRGYRPMEGRDLADGRLRWRDDAPTGAQLRPLPVPGGVLTSAVHGRELRLLDPSTGLVRRRWAAPQPVVPGDLWPAASVTGDGAALLRCGARSVVGLDPAGGPERVWEHPVALADVAAVLAGGTLWVAEQRAVAAVDVAAQRITGTVALTERPTTQVVPHALGALALCSSGLVRLVAADGRVLHQLSVDRRAGAMTAAAPGMVHVLGKGEVIGLDVP